jgi:hypothetical protein
VPKDGAEMRAGVRVLKALRLHEVSVVSLPADSGARISSVKERRAQFDPSDLDDLPQTLREFERWLHSVGFSKTRACAIANKGWRVDDDPNPNVIQPADIPTVATGLLALFKSIKG